MRRVEHLIALLVKIGPTFSPAAILASDDFGFKGWMVMRFGTKRRFGEQ